MEIIPYDVKIQMWTMGGEQVFGEGSVCKVLAAQGEDLSSNLQNSLKLGWEHSQHPYGEMMRSRNKLTGQLAWHEE